MKTNIYYSEGWVNMRAIMNLPYTFIFVIGGRGTGKTYGMLSTVVEDGLKMMYLRRTNDDALLVGNPEFSPFKPICADKGWVVDVKPISKYNSKMTLKTEDSERDIGYTCGLSTIQHVRGFDASDIDILVYDEFIPEDHVRRIKNEHLAFLNAYETMNRNREILGKPAMKCICMSNSNSVENDLFKGLGLLEVAERMQRKHQEIYLNKERDLCIIILRDSIISQKKAETALYRFSKGVTAFTDMALGNEFSELNDRRIRPQDLSQYTPMFTIGDITMYRHKSENKYYVSHHKSGKPVEYGDEDSEVLRCRTTYAGLYLSYIHNRVLFENYACKSKFIEIFS